MYFCISERRRGPSNVAGPGVAYPLPHPLDGPGDDGCKYDSNLKIHKFLRQTRVPCWKVVILLVLARLAWNSCS